MASSVWRYGERCAFDVVREKEGGALERVASTVMVQGRYGERSERESDGVLVIQRQDQRNIRETRDEIGVG